MKEIYLKIKQKIQQLIKKINLKYLVKEFKDEVDLSKVTKYQQLSENFIKEFKNGVDWRIISKH